MTIISPYSTFPNSNSDGGLVDWAVGLVCELETNESRRPFDSRIWGRFFVWGDLKSAIELAWEHSEMQNKEQEGGL